MNLFHFTLATSRRFLYITIVTLALTTVLLPWSVLSYLRFYNTIIPKASYRLPVKVSRSKKGHLVGVYSDTTDLVSALKESFDPSYPLNYDVVLDLQVYCPRALVGDSVLVMGKLYWGHDAQDGRRGAAHDVDDDTGRSSFLVHCDPRSIYSSSNWLIPYNLRLWVPPFLTNGEKLNRFSVKLGTVSETEILSLLNSNKKRATPKHATQHPQESAVVEKDSYKESAHSSDIIYYEINHELLVDAEHSFLNINVEWRGIRYYLFYHYYVCFAAGVALFWGVSSGACFGVSMLVWYLIRSSFSKQKTS